MAPVPATDPTVTSRYASTDPGFDAVPVSSLLAEHRALLDRIKLCYGSDRATFERDLMPLVRGYAAFVHLLPATADNYFSAPGGLLRLGLETAFFSLQGTDAHIFSGRATITARRELEPRWRTATFIGGLCCELHCVLSHLIVTTRDGSEWPSLLLPLADWLRQRGAERYFLRWRPKAAESRGLGLFALPLVVPSSVLQQLSHDDGAIVRQLLASIGGVPQYRDHNVLDGLVRRSLALVIDRNLLANADRYGSPQYGSHLERYLVDALRRLAAGHSAWIPNRDKSRLWYGQDGLYLAWPGAANDVIGLLEGDQLAGVPKSPETMLDLLLEAKVLSAMPGGARTWPIASPGANTVVEAVKLASPAIVLVGIDPAPQVLPAALYRPPDEPRTTTAASPSPSATLAGATQGPAQLSLLDPADAPAPTSLSAAGPKSADALPAEAPASPPTTSARPIRLKAPMRLNPSVRSALTDAVDALNDPPDGVLIFTVAEGIFVPLLEFERRGVQPSIAIRALSDAAMLVKPSRPGPPTVSREIKGATIVGLVVQPVFVEGLDPAAFLVTTTSAG